MNLLNYTTLLTELKLATEDANRYLEQYSRLHLIVGAIVGTWILLRLVDFWRDGDLSWPTFKARAFRLLISLPFIRSIAAKEMASMDKTVVKQCRKIYQGESFMQTLPRKGFTPDQIYGQLKKYQDLSKIK